MSCAAFGILRVVAVGGGESSANSPILRDFDRGLDRDFFDWRVGWVEEEFFPLEDSEFLADTRGDDAVEMGVQSGDPGGNGDVELVEVLVVTTPGENLAVGGKDDPGDLIDWAGWAMVAGNPLWGGERDWARLDWDVDFGVVELARSVGEVRGDLDGGLLGLQDSGGT